jgi:hypothetical protein
MESKDTTHQPNTQPMRYQVIHTSTLAPTDPTRVLSPFKWAVYDHDLGSVLTTFKTAKEACEKVVEWSETDDDFNDE